MLPQAIKDWFPASAYPFELDKNIYTPPKQTTVYSAQTYLHSIIEWNLRASERPLMLSETTEVEIVTAILPDELQEHMQTQCNPNNVAMPPLGCYGRCPPKHPRTPMSPCGS
eukprot:GHVS01067931.1.p1 GENE.GHVS01067931.1~~GHVS01067931.1.p1  ORF type:complete len:112 (+),score=0.98 GHVS01067931.1:432-767(+)